MSRSTNIEGETQQIALIASDRDVASVRCELETLMADAVSVDDVDSLLGIAQEMDGYLIFLQWKEQQMLPLITDAKARFNEMQEIVRVSEDREALRLNDAGTPMGRAEKMARISMSEMRKTLNEMQEIRNRHEDEYTDLKGFRSVVESCLMTVRQKIKSLISEYKGTPFQS